MTLPRRPAVILSAVTVVAALGLSGCGQSARLDSEQSTATVATSPPPTVGLAPPSPPARGGPPLPSPSALIDVVSRLSDPALGPDEKVALIENGTADEAAGLERFSVALRDSGALPLTFEARDLAWSQADPGNVVATVVIRTADPQTGEFTFPMEFAPEADSWQLTRQTADLFLELDGEPSPVPPAEPAPAEPPPGAPPPAEPPTPTPTR